MTLIPSSRPSLLLALRVSASAAALLVGGALGLYFAGPALGAGPVTPIEVATSAIPLNRADPALGEVGRLRYMGGLVLKSKNMRFGGISDMLWEPACNRLLAVTDAGSWIVLEPEERDGRLAGISAGWIAPLKDPSGAVPQNKSAADAEGMARLADGSTWVSFEQNHRVERFPTVSACRPESLGATPDKVWAPDEMKAWPANGGAEAIEGRGDSILILSESQPGPDGGRIAFSGVPKGPVRLFGWEPPAGYEPTAIRRLSPDDDLHVVLHRRFTPLEGVSAALSIASFPAEPQAMVSGEEIARLRPPFNVDNMEALAVRKEGERTFIYLMSDDNFNVLQRTLLLKFELLPKS